jgi:hypothetical protein
MTSLTLDQLSYVLERKYKNIIIGHDAIISCSVNLSDDNRKYIKNPDAEITEWRLLDIDKPSDDLLGELWNKLKDQYNSDPTRVDSDMYKYIYPETPLVSVEEIDI